MLGVMTNQNQSLDKDTIELLAAEYGINAEQKVHEDISDIDNIYDKRMEESKESKNQVKRPPVVTIMDTLTMVRPLYLIVFVILMFQLMKLVVLLKRLVLTKLD